MEMLRFLQVFFGTSSVRLCEKLSRKVSLVARELRSVVR